MRLTAIDWAIVAAYFTLSTGIGFYFTKRGGESLTEYFLSGRDVPWWLAGASMVATTLKRAKASPRSTKSARRIG